MIIDINNNDDSTENPKQRYKVRASLLLALPASLHSV